MIEGSCRLTGNGSADRERFGAFSVTGRPRVEASGGYSDPCCWGLLQEGYSAATR